MRLDHSSSCDWGVEKHRCAARPSIGPQTSGSPCTAPSSQVSRHHHPSHRSANGLRYPPRMSRCRADGDRQQIALLISDSSAGLPKAPTWCLTGEWPPHYTSLCALGESCSIDCHPGCWHREIGARDVACFLSLGKHNLPFHPEASPPLHPTRWPCALNERRWSRRLQLTSSPDSRLRVWTVHRQKSISTQLRPRLRAFLPHGPNYRSLFRSG